MLVRPPLLPVLSQVQGVHQGHEDQAPGPRGPREMLDAGPLDIEIDSHLKDIEIGQFGSKTSQFLIRKGPKFGSGIAWVG